MDRKLYERDQKNPFFVSPYFLALLSSFVFASISMLAIHYSKTGKSSVHPDLIFYNPLFWGIMAGFFFIMILFIVSWQSPKAFTGKRVFSFGPSLRLVFAVGTIFFAVLGIFMIVLVLSHKIRMASIAVIGGGLFFLLFCGGCAYFAKEAFASVILDDEGVRKVFPGGKSDFLSWAEIEKVSYSLSWCVLILTGKENIKIRLSLLMNDTATLADELLKRIDKERLLDAEKGFLIAKGQMDLYGREIDSQ